MDARKDLPRLTKDEKTAAINMMLDFYGELLSKGQQEALSLFYAEDLSLGEIAEITGITRQGVRDRIVKGERMLYATEERLRLVARFMEQKQVLAQIAQRLEALRPLCGDRTDEIIDMIGTLL